MEPGLLRLAELGLQVAGRYGFALAGGYAVQAHGILDRPSEEPHGSAATTSPWPSRPS